MDESGPAIPSSDFLLRPASGQTSADIDPPSVALAKSDEPVAAGWQSRSAQVGPCRNDLPDGPSDAAYYRNEEEVREGFLIALRAMGVEQNPEPATPPVRGAKR
jgi:hypothetical protein